MNQRIAFSRKELCERLGCSRAYLQLLEQRGLLRSVKLGGRRFIPASELARLGLLPPERRVEG